MPFPINPDKYKVNNEGIISIMASFSRAISSHLSGSGGGVIHRVHPMSGLLCSAKGIENLINEITLRAIKANISEGDIISCCSIVFSVAQNRKVPEELLFSNGDPCKLTFDALSKLSSTILTSVNFPVDEGDILGVNNENGFYYLLPHNPNGLCEQISKSIKQKAGVNVDVIISDTDAGYFPGVVTIGSPILGSMPIGATAGISLSNCLEIAYLSELTWGADKQIPCVRIEPEKNSNKTWLTILRENIGQGRGYEGRLNFIKEGWEGMSFVG